MGRIWKELGERKLDQNILYFKKNLFLMEKNK